MLVAREVAAQSGCESAVLLALRDFQGLASGCYSLGVPAGFGIHGGEHLKDLRLAVVGDLCGVLELRQSFAESVACCVSAAEVVMALGRVRCESYGLLKFLDGFFELALAREDHAIEVMAY